MVQCNTGKHGPHTLAKLTRFGLCIGYNLPATYDQRPVIGYDSAVRAFNEIATAIQTPAYECLAMVDEAHSPFPDKKPSNSGSVIG